METRAQHTVLLKRTQREKKFSSAPSYSIFHRLCEYKAQDWCMVEFRCIQNHRFPPQLRFNWFNIADHSLTCGYCDIAKDTNDNVWTADYNCWSLLLIFAHTAKLWLHRLCFWFQGKFSEFIISVSTFLPRNYCSIGCPAPPKPKERDSVCCTTVLGIDGGC